MKRLLLACFAALCTFWCCEVIAQERPVSGKVTSAEDGSELPGVNVVIKGTAVGTVTDADGNYTISAPGDGTLVFSFIGLQSQEVPISSRSVVDVTMQPDVQQLSEVVVTAVGIEREAKGLGYSVENVTGSKVQQVAEVDPLRALQGKVAGVNISGTSGAPGSSTNITIRGNTSLLGTNQPLFVVDGIPYNNNSNGSFDGLQNGAAYSSRFSDLDPNNIESISILKGGAAAALYGTRAANGVVVITTKTGRSRMANKGLEVSFASTYALEEIAQLPDFQNTYGTGTNFNYAQANGSWGAPFQGKVPYETITEIPHWYNNRAGMEQFWGTTVPYRAYPNNVKDLFNAGSLFENTITISGGNENSTLTTTISRSKNEGYVPNTEFNRTNISIGGRTHLVNKLTVGANLAFTTSYQRAVQSGVGLSGSNNSSAFSRALFLGRNWDVQGQPYQNPVDFGSEFMVARGQADNPYWSYENAGVESNVNRILASMDFSYDFNDWINATYKIGINTYTEELLDFIRRGSTGPSSNPGAGRIVEDNTRFQEIESNFIINFTPKISETFSLRGLIGHNVNQRTTDRQAVQGIGYVVFDIDDLDNTNEVTPFGGTYQQRRIYGVFGDVTLGYRDWAFLNLTARNDWSSTLPKGNNSFFYPAASLSVIVSEALGWESNIVDNLKVRAAVSQVGKDTDPYQLIPVYLVNPQNSTGVQDFPFLGQPGATLSNIERDPNLKPERTQDFEVGVDMRMFQDRFGISATYYKRRSFDQIAPVSLPAASGFDQYFTNFGELSNRGVEITLDATPVRLSNGFTWNILGVFTHNKNVIEELTAGVNEIQFGFGFAGGVINTHRPGQEFGLLLGTVPAKDDEGNLLIDPSNGQLLTAFDRAIIGNPNPDFRFGLTNTFSFKGFTLSAVIDWKQGGDLWSNTVQSMLGRGVLKEQEDREMNVVIPGVYGDATSLEPIRTEEGNKIQNTTMIEQNALWFGNTFAVNGLDEYSVWDATYIKLREVSLGYTLPKSLLANTFIGSASILLTGRNLWYTAPNFPESSNYDPEVNQFGISNAQGIEWAATPTVKRYGVTVKLTF